MTPLLLGLGRQEVGMVLEILVLTAAIYAVLRFLRSTRGFGVITGLGIFIVLFFAGFFIVSNVRIGMNLPILFGDKSANFMLTLHD